MSKLWPWSVRKSAETGSAAKRFLADSGGNIAVMTAYMTPLIFGIGAFAFDMGQWNTTAESFHLAADKSAISALSASTNGGDGFSTAQAIMAEMGYPCSAPGNPINGSMTCTGPNGFSLTVNNPPRSGAFTTSSGAWEVSGTVSTDLRFARWFLPRAPTVGARAVSNASLSVCILALDTDSSHNHSIFATQNADVKIDCAAWDNLPRFDNKDSVDVKNGGRLHFKDLGMVVGQTCDPNCEGTLIVDNPIQYNKPPVADPYASRSLPTPGSCNRRRGHRNWFTNSSTNMSPGTYCSGITITGGTVTMSPGVYIIDGGDLTVSNATLTGSGVTIVLTTSSGDPSQIGRLNVSNGQVNISAPTSSVNGDDVAGMAIWQDARAPQPTGAGAGDPNHFLFPGGAFQGDKNNNVPTTGLNIIATGSSTKIDGVLYFPSQAVVYNGGTTGGVDACTQIVAHQILFNGGAGFNYPSHCPQLGITTITANGGGKTGIVE